MPILAITQGTVTGVLTQPNQTKVYGNDDPALNTVDITVTGLVNRTVADWNGSNPTVNDSENATSAASLTRAAGENVGNNNVSQGTIQPSPNYIYSSVLHGTHPILAITQGTVTGVLTQPNQTKVYGNDDPALNTVDITVTGLVNRTVADWNGTNPTVRSEERRVGKDWSTRCAREHGGNNNDSAGTFQRITNHSVT